MDIIGTGPSDNTGNTNTTIQACKSGQANCGGNVFGPGQAVIQMGTSSSTVFRSTVKELAVDCQDVPGASGFQVVAAQEETVFDLVRATGCKVAGFDIGLGDSKTMNGAALSNFEVNYTNGAGCPAITQGTIAGVVTPGVSRMNGVVTVNLTGIPIFPQLVPGYEVVIAGVSDGTFNGTYRVQAVNSSTQFTYLQNTNLSNVNSGGGTASLYSVGVRVWQNSTNHVRPIVNGTINGTDCGTSPPVAVELSGGSPLLQAIHAEGFATGVQIGDLTGTSGATLIDVKLAPSTTGVVISNQWQTGTVTPAFQPTGGIDIFNLDVSGGSGTYALKDNINNNQLTAAANATVGYYLFGLNGVTTNAVPETGLTNAVDTNGQTLAIYSGSSSSTAFSAASSGVSIGGGSNLTTSNQTGTGSLVLANTPTLITPIIGVATGTSLALGGGSALTTTAHTGTNNLVLDTSPTLSSPTLSSPTISSGVANNGSGAKHIRSSSTPITGGSRVEILLTWSGSWSTTSYSVTCSVEQATGTASAVGLVGERIRTKSTTQIGYIVNNPAAASLSGIVDCIGLHD